MVIREVSWANSAFLLYDTDRLKRSASAVVETVNASDYRNNTQVQSGRIQRAACVVLTRDPCTLTTQYRLFKLLGKDWHHLQMFSAM